MVPSKNKVAGCLGVYLLVFGGLYLFAALLELFRHSLGGGEHGLTMLGVMLLMSTAAVVLGAYLVMNKYRTTRREARRGLQQSAAPLAAQRGIANPWSGTTGGQPGEDGGMDHLVKRANQIGQFFSKVSDEDSVGVVIVESPAEAEFLEALAREMHPGRAIFSVMAVQQGSSVEIAGVPPDQRGPFVFIVRRAAVAHVKAHPLWGGRVIGTLGD